MADRVVLFVDYQNVYMAARQAFDPSPRAIPHWEGQVDPLVLGQLLVTRSPFDRTLTGVRMYRGLPDSTKDPKGYGACMRQIATWSRPEEVQVVARPLRYPYGWPSNKPEEKGIDVSIAVDFVLMAARGDYDVGILMSADTDLKPALEAVVSLGAARVEVAAWSSQYGHSRRLAIKGRGLWCHWLDDSECRSVQDTRDYTLP
ncbi:MAG: NYN domain-containing protein [bacterium]|nr:NYN domain-containing protein [bacterium]MYB43359.1 NYN domain-containing protein [Acidimicrobiia bacterium]